MSQSTPSEALDFTRIARELVRAVRGRRSQAYINRRLGLNFNQSHRWETGRKQVSWQEFAGLCRITKTPLRKALDERLFLGGGVEEGSEVFQALLANLTQQAAADLLKVSRYAVSRWSGGQVAVPLDQMLRLIHLKRSALSDFVSALIDMERMPSLKGLHDRIQQQRALHLQYPIVAALTTATEVADYAKLKRHRPGVLAKLVGISLKEEQRLLALMESAELVTQLPGGKYRVHHARVNMPRGFGKSIREYWTQHCLARLQRTPVPPPYTGVGYHAYSVSEEAKRKVWERYLQFYNDFRNILAEDQGAMMDEVYVLLVHLWNLGGSAED